MGALKNATYYNVNWHLKPPSLASSLTKESKQSVLQNDNHSIPVKKYSLTDRQEFWSNSSILQLLQ